MGQQAGLLEYQSQPPLVERQKLPPLLPALLVEMHPGALGVLQPRDNAQQGGLAAAGSAKQRSYPFGGQIDVHIQAEFASGQPCPYGQRHSLAISKRRLML